MACRLVNALLTRPGGTRRPFESGGDHPAGRPVIRPRRQARISRPWWRPADPRAGVWSAVLAVGMAQPAPDGLPGDARVDELAGMRVTRLMLPLVTINPDRAFLRQCCLSKELNRGVAMAQTPVAEPPVSIYRLRVVLAGISPWRSCGTCCIGAGLTALTGLRSIVAWPSIRRWGRSCEDHRAGQRGHPGPHRTRGL